MPRVYRRRGYSRTYRRSRWPYRSWRRRSLTRSQQSGRRYFNISFPTENIVSLNVASGQSFSTVLRTSPYFSPVGTADTDANRASNCCGLPGSIAFRKYCQLYDQVKVNSVSFVVSLANVIGSEAFPGVRCYTSWDRNYVYAEDMVSADDLINGPESQVVTFINNSRAKFSRYNYASDLQERTTFIDSTIQYSANQFWANKQWVRGSGSNMAGYVPSMSLVFQTSNTSQALRTITVQIQARYNVTFRNPKFGLSVEGNSKGVDSDEMSRDESFSDMKESVIEDAKNGVSGFDEETIKKLKALLHEDVQLPLTDEDTRMSMEDDEKEKVS